MKPVVMRSHKLIFPDFKFSFKLPYKVTLPAIYISTFCMTSSGGQPWGLQSKNASNALASTSVPLQECWSLEALFGISLEFYNHIYFYCGIYLHLKLSWSKGARKYRLLILSFGALEIFFPFALGRLGTSISKIEVLALLYTKIPAYAFLKAVINGTIAASAEQAWSKRGKVAILFQ